MVWPGCDLCFKAGCTLHGQKTGTNTKFHRISLRQLKLMDKVVQSAIQTNPSLNWSRGDDDNLTIVYIVMYIIVMCNNALYSV